MNKKNKKFNPGGMFLLPPAPNLCQECAAEHEPGNAHNQQSLYYQFKFHAETGRSPTWKDAIAHCVPEVKDQWIAQLKQRGIEV